MTAAKWVTWNEFPLRDFRNLHEAVTGMEFKAESVEDDIRFLSLFTKSAADAMRQTGKLQNRAGLPDRVPSGRVCKRSSPDGQALLAHWDEEYQELKDDADRKRTQGIAPRNAPRVPPDQSAFVFILDPGKTPVLAFCVERRHASAFAAVRVKDFMEGSGDPYSYRIVE